MMAPGQKIRTAPVDTGAADALRVTVAGELAALVPLTGATCEQAYVGTMVKSPAEALEMIDGHLPTAGKAKRAPKHLGQVREDVVSRLEGARSAR